jgi:prolyl oligopeptidase
LGPDDLFSADVTDDGRYLVVEIDRGVPARRVDIVFRDLSKQDAPFEILVWGLDSRFSAIYAMGSWFVRTDYQAPNGRILKAEPGIMPGAWKTIVPEGLMPIENFSIVGGKLYVMRLKDVKSETAIYTLEGKPAGRIDYDGIGSASHLEGKATRPLRFLQLPVVHSAADNLPAGYSDRQARYLFASRRFPSTPASMR